MQNIPEFIWLILSLILIAIVGFYGGRWIIFRIKQTRRMRGITSVIGDSLAHPMDVYGSAIAPGRSSAMGGQYGDAKTSTLPLEAEGDSTRE